METSCVGIVRGGLTPVKARTVPNRMVWVNGCGCQRAYSYQYCAADAEIPVAFRSLRPSRPIVLSVSVLTSRTALYGPVCSVVWEGGAVRLLPIPMCDVHRFLSIQHFLYFFPEPQGHGSFRPIFTRIGPFGLLTVGNSVTVLFSTTPVLKNPSSSFNII